MLLPPLPSPPLHLIRAHVSQVLLEDAQSAPMDVPAKFVTDRHLSIFWRMLRPEFVKGDAEAVAYRVREVVSPQRA